MNKIKHQTRNARARWPEISALCLLLVLSGCDEPPTSQELADAKIFLEAIEKNKEFGIKVEKGEKAAIDLTYLDDKFPGMDICYHHAYGVGRTIRRKTKGKKEIDINKGDNRIGKETRDVYFIEEEKYYVYHLNDDYIYSLSSLNNKKENGNLHVNYQCIKARDVKFSLEAGHNSKRLEEAEKAKELRQHSRNPLK